MSEHQEDDECITIKVAKPKPHTDLFSKHQISLLENNDGEQDLKTSKKSINREEFDDLSLSTSQKCTSAVITHMNAKNRIEIINQLKKSLEVKQRRRPEADSCCKCLII